MAGGRAYVARPAKSASDTVA